MLTSCNKRDFEKVIKDFEIILKYYYNIYNIIILLWIIWVVPKEGRRRRVRVRKGDIRKEAEIGIMMEEGAIGQGMQGY